jgi:hypothetical protein
LVRSFPRLDMAYDAQGIDLVDQIVQVSERSSTWILAPEPVRFMRKQNRAERFLEITKLSPMSSFMSAGTEIENMSNNSATAEIDSGVWNFANNRNLIERTHTLSSRTKYYQAHRQHVAEELIKSDTVPTMLGDSCSKLWDGLLLELSM